MTVPPSVCIRHHTENSLQTDNTAHRVSVLVEGWGAAASDQVDGFSPAVYGGMSKMSAPIPKAPPKLVFLGLNLFLPRNKFSFVFQLPRNKFSFVLQLSRNVCCYAIFARMFLILHLDVLQWSS